MIDTRICSSYRIVLWLNLLGVSSGAFSPLLDGRRFTFHPNLMSSPMMVLEAIPSRRTCVVTVPLALLAKSLDDQDDEKNLDEQQPQRKQGKKPESNSASKRGDSEAKKQELVKAVGERMRMGISKSKAKDQNSLLDRLNPFKAGQKLRQTIDTALTSINREEGKSIYYIDDRFSSIAEMGSALDRLEQDDNWIPEILVVGATCEIGRIVVKRLLLDGRFRVRVLVPDLYTKTLNMLGTGVTYCQGDLNNMESLEYAVTDVDKIVFCSNPPRPDEEKFQEKFQEFMQQNLQSRGEDSHELAETVKAKSVSGEEWEQLESVLQVRAQLAEQVDLIGLKNLIHAFHNVRHADYGTSQTVKRLLFKFKSREDDFNLFSIEESDDDDNQSNIEESTDKESSNARSTSSKGKDGSSSSLTSDYDYDDENYNYGNTDDDEAKYADYMNDDDEANYAGYMNSNDDFYGSGIESRRDTSVKTQTKWLRNKYGSGVFVGRVPQATDASDGGEAAVISSRFRSRQDPEKGIELGAGFAGFILRVCSDGGKYEAFVRTGAFYDDGVEYVCEFSTASKPIGRGVVSKKKYTTVRLPFENFKPVQKKGMTGRDIPPFRGSDVRHIGFRYRSVTNKPKSKLEFGKWSSFYMALSYIKLYRSQPEPEFVYLSDAQIPPVVRRDMIRHGAKQLVTTGGDSGGAAVLLKESTLQSATRNDIGRSPEEVYYKFRGEELLKNSGLSYAIARVSGFNEMPASETTTIDLRPLNENVAPVSRAELAQVCVSALMDPNALNKSFYVTKKTSAVQATDETEDMKAKFRALPFDVVP